MVTGDFKPLVCRISFLLLHSTSQVINGKRLNVHIIMDDPAGNSYIQVSMLTSHCTEGGGGAHVWDMAAVVVGL